MANLTTIEKSGQQIEFVAENAFTYLVGTLETATLVTQDEAVLTNILKS